MDLIVTVFPVITVPDVLENGHPYEMRIQPYNKVDNITKYGTTYIIYGAPNPRITAITAMPENKGATFRVVKHATADGFRYNVYPDGSSARKAYYDVSLKSGSIVRKASGLTNGKLYYVTAIPYTLINGTKYWGASMYRIYFVPLSAPSNAKVSFSGTKATVSMSADSAATGIRVLYRKAGGAMVNGCEASSSKCSITGLSQSGSYEFYVMKYKTVNGKKHYGPGVTLAYKTPASGLPAPSKPLIAKRDSTKLSFTIEKSSNAQGISVLYRENEGKFIQACEAKAATCAKTGFDWNKNYTFYIMQFRTVNGKKVYSPGVTVTNWLTPKSADLNSAEKLTGLVYREVGEPSDLYEALEDYYSEKDLMRDEAYQLLEGTSMALTGASEEDPDEAEETMEKGAGSDGQLTDSEDPNLTRHENGQDAFAALFGPVGLPATGFSSRHTTVLPAQPMELNYQPLRMRLQIPSLAMETDLVTVPLARDAWQVKWLGNKAGVLDGSALPGEGYSVVAAHNTLSDTEYGPFALLNKLEVNDTVIVSGPNGKMKLFRVYASELLNPDGAEKLVSVAERESNSLVLLTCENETAEGGYLNRRAVFAKFISEL